MVRTSKGPAEKSEPKKAFEKAQDAPAAKATMTKPPDLDDDTWSQIESMARSQNTTTSEVIRRAIVNQYGQVNPTGALHSGQKTDPSLAS